MAAPANTSPAKKAFALRLDPEVHAAIERLAAAELRSANAEIEVLLREALKARGIEVERSEAARRGRPPKDANLQSGQP
ncbi:MAG: toxin-antitoxin system HicB family antitoxin [Pseudomonadota bacterium]